MILNALLDFGSILLLSVLRMGHLQLPPSAIHVQLEGTVWEVLTLETAQLGISAKVELQHPPLIPCARLASTVSTVPRYRSLVILASSDQLREVSKLLIAQPAKVGRSAS
jgi:hypothetical protein